MVTRITLGVSLASSVIAVGACRKGSDATGCDPSDDPAACELGEAEEAEGDVPVDMGDEEGSSSGGSTGTESDSGLPPAPFSELPPFDILGAEWTYRVTPVGGGTESTTVCRISEVSQWPDGSMRSRLDCDGVYAEYSITEDRIFRRTASGTVFEPAALLYHVPLDVGDSWQVDFALGAFQVSETWSLLAEEAFVVDGADRRAIVLDVDGVTNGQGWTMRTWWVSGVGPVRDEDELLIRELISFSVP